MDTVISIVVNGETRETQPGVTVADLLRTLGMNAGRVAVERNLQILPRPQWTETPIAAGDHFEIVQFVGGG